MKSLADFSDIDILGWWCAAEPGDEYTRVVRELFADHQLRVSPDQVKADIDRRLREQVLIPLDRKPLKADYIRAQMVWVASHDDICPS